MRFYKLKATMNIEELREYALSLKNVTESFPFGNDTLVFKVDNKIFLLASLSSEVLQFNVKCNPEYAVELREQYSCILPGYHMNKKHWNTIIIDGHLSTKQLKEFIKDSYMLVAKKK
jgi:predicted DNA-binding protein (MmcQ/YjbR family)